MTGTQKFEFYHYEPSLRAAIVFIVLFVATTALHLWQMVRTRTWFFLAFCLGGFAELVGYIGRAKSATESDQPDYSLGAYILQSVLLLVAPALLAASLYMQLGRVVELVGGDALLPLRRRRLTPVFVLGDVASFALQSAGAGLLASREQATRDGGSRILVAGLFVQIASFGAFLALALVFHLRLRRAPTPEVRGARADGTAAAAPAPCARHLVALYLAGGLILARSVVRAVEFIQGFDGYIVSHEVFLYVFDAVPMWVVMLVMNCVHPSEIQRWLGRGRMIKGFHLAKV